MEMSDKKTKGRQKIEMKRIKNEEHRLITFCKRRSGVYKKASELATLCGAQVGLVIFSPTGKPFSFGHPSIEAVGNRLMNRNPPQGYATHPLVEAHLQARIDELNRQYNELVMQLEAEKERAKALKKLTEEEKDTETETKGWWETPLEGLSLEELQQRNASLEELYNNLMKCVREKLAGAPSSSFAETSARGNPFAASASGTDPSTFPPTYGYGGQLP